MKNRFEQNLKTKLIKKAGQKKLTDASVWIIGAGGVGCSAFTYLYYSGIGKLTVIDKDNVEHSNLNRQILYTENHVGQAKVLAIRDVASSQFPYTDSQIVKTWYTPFDSFTKTFDRTDKDTRKKYKPQLIIDCSDNYKTKKQVQNYAIKNKIPCIISGIHGYNVHVFAWHPKHSYKTYMQLFAGNEGNNEALSEGTFPTTSGILGTMVANEALKIILGLHDQVLYNKIFFFNTLYCNLLKL